ncbi:hypothetical protein V6N11_014056 [Hibiscus sabdariffa]|uniref:Uncharacterized protein n=1 Tax=Hibiscus sabdariffa TaxID=183260 RepID=A0ABR2AFJ0_9ROSI
MTWPAVGSMTEDSAKKELAYSQLPLAGTITFLDPFGNSQHFSPPLPQKRKRETVKLRSTFASQGKTRNNRCRSAFSVLQPTHKDPRDPMADCGLIHPKFKANLEGNEREEPISSTSQSDNGE